MIAAVWSLWVAPGAGAAAPAERLTVAVTATDLEAIVKAVGGDQVVTFSLFKGCILRQGLAVEVGVRDRLLRANAVVWSGFFNESAAVYDAVKGLEMVPEGYKRPVWIDVSRGAHRVNVPISSCEGYVEVSFMYGDPFFWLNPKNGRVIARNVAEELAALRPDRRAYFFANAEAFRQVLNKDIERWRKALEPIAALKVFSAQCGWQNFAQVGGPSFATCKGTPGQLPAAQVLADHVNQMGCQIVLVDPNTPPQYGLVFREETKARVIEVPSSLDDLAGGQRYQDLFDNLVKKLVEAGTS